MSVDFSDIWYADSSSPSGLRWKIDIVCSNGIVKCFKDKVAGTIQTRKTTIKRKASNTEKYWQVRYKGRGYKVHRVLYSILNNITVFDKIDHIDGNGLNNKIDNLRDVDDFLNARNVKKSELNTTGVTGVSVQYSKPGHEGQKYYRASVRGMDGKYRAKLFSCKLGEQAAKKAACLCRQEMIDELNAQGAGYSERHGGIK